LTRWAGFPLFKLDRDDELSREDVVRTVKVLVLTQYFWPENFRINEIATSLRDAGCEVCVLTGQPNYPEGVIHPGYSTFSLKEEDYMGLAVYRVPMVGRGRASALRLAANYLSFVAFGSVFGPWLLRRKAVDVVFVYGISPILQAIPAIWIGWLKGAKVVTWVQDQWPESLSATGFVRQRSLLAAVAVVVRWIYRRCDLLLVQSRAFIAPVKHLAGATPVEYHANPGELAFDRDQDTWDAPLSLAAGFNVMFAGNLGTVQSLDTILEAAERVCDLTDVRFVFVGSGSRDGWLADEVRRRGLTNVQLVGRFAADLMPSILSQASALLVTLVQNPIMAQTIPSKIQAYLAAGKPILAGLDGEGAAIVLEAKAGLVCPAEDGPGLADAVRRLYALSEVDRDKMGAAGRAYYQRHFDPAVLAERLKVRLERLVDGEQGLGAGREADAAKDSGK
jgi:glycosyltransferase involved in cell wall biosynthesis